MLGIELAEIAGGALIVSTIFVAFVGWAVLPLIPFALMGAVYATIRYGVPALGRAAMAVEHGIIWMTRQALRPMAVWALADQELALARRPARG